MSESIDIRRARWHLEAVIEEHEIRKASPVCHIEACSQRSSVYNFCTLHARMYRVPDPRREGK